MHGAHLGAACAGLEPRRRLSGDYCVFHTSGFRKAWLLWFRIGVLGQLCFVLRVFRFAHLGLRSPGVAFDALAGGCREKRVRAPACMLGHWPKPQGFLTAPFRQPEREAADFVCRIRAGLAAGGTRSSPLPPASAVILLLGKLPDTCVAARP